MLPRLSVALVALMALSPRPGAGEYGRRAAPTATPAARRAAPTATPAAAADATGPIPHSAGPPGATEASPLAATATPAAPAPALPPPIPTPVPTATPRPTPTPMPTGTVEVRVLVTGADGKTLPAADAVVWLPGLRGPAPAAPRMASREKRFEPRVLAVPKGAKVDFPNYDKIFHNVFSLSEASRFDLGLYRNGAARAASFETPGVVRVYCNIHPQMAAFVVVVDGNLYAQTGKDGVARIAAVPTGRHAIRAWEERGGDWSGTVLVTPNGTASLIVPFDASKWREQPHKNKHGKDYPPPDDDENRY